MISNKNKKKKHIIFNYLSPKNEMLARILSQMNFNIFYLKLKNYNKETGFIEKKVKVLKEKNINPLPIQNLDKLYFFHEYRSDPEKIAFNATLNLVDRKLSKRLSHLFPNILNLDEKLIFVLQSKIFELNRDCIFFLKNWLKNNPDVKLYYVHFGFDGFLLKYLERNTNKIIIPTISFNLLKKFLILLFKKFKNIFLKINKNKIYDKKKDSFFKEKIALVSHGITYGEGRLFEKDFFYSNDENSIFSKEKILHLTYLNIDQPDSNLKWINLKKINFSINKTILFLLKFAKVLIYVRSFKNLKLFLFYLSFLLRVFIYTDIVSRFKELKFALIDFDLLCPKALLLAFQNCKIKTISVQERPITSFYFSRNFLMLDFYLVASEYVKENLENSEFYMINEYKTVGQYRTDYLNYHLKQKPVKIIYEAKKNNKKIITALGYHTPINEHESITDPHLNWKAHEIFLNDMIKLSENIENAYFMLRYKYLDWMNLKYFSAIIERIKNKKNICIYDVYENQDTYKICSHSDLIISQASSIADECMAFGLPVLFHNYSHNLLNDKSIIFDYNKANLCFDFNELLNKTKDCLNNTPFLNSLLESNKRVYGNLSDGNVKMRSHKILKDYINKGV